MAMSRDEFRDALAQVAMEEFDHIPADETAIDCEFSPQFQRRMEKLIRSRKKSYYALVCTAARRVAVVCLCCVLMLATALSVEAVRDPVLETVEEMVETVKQFVGVKEEFLYFESDPTLSIDTEYWIKWYPVKFRQVGVYYSYEEDSYKQIKHVLTNEQITITFTQTVWAHLCGESAYNAEIVRVGEVDVLITTKKNTVQALWVLDRKYEMCLLIEGDVSVEDVCKMIESIVPDQCMPDKWGLS